MKAKDEFDQLEKMVQTAETHLSGTVPESGELPELDQDPTFNIDYDKLQKDCNKRAKKLLKQSSGLVMGDELVKDNTYLKQKIETDVISLAGMLYQMEITKIIQRDLTEEVSHGAKSPRMYEVFSTLVKVISENNKQLIQTLEALKETYVSLRGTIEERNAETKQIGDGEQRSADGLLTVGSRELIDAVNNAKRERILASHNKIVDITPEL